MNAFSLPRTLLMVATGLLALLGLFAAAASRDLGLSLFGYGLMLFGVLFTFFTIKRGWDEVDLARKQQAH